MRKESKIKVTFTIPEGQDAHEVKSIVVEKIRELVPDLTKITADVSELIYEQPKGE